MGCGTNIVPGFNESNKIKDPALEMKITSEIDASPSNRKDYIKEAEKRLDLKQKKSVGKESDSNKKFRNKAEEMKDMDIDRDLMYGPIDHSALRLKGAELPRGAEGTILGDDKNSHSIVEKGSHFDGRYMWFLHGGTRDNVLKSILKWGGPSQVTWSSSRNLKPEAFYRASDDRIVTTTYASGFWGLKIFGDILYTLLHETFHWVDFALGRHRYPEAQSVMSSTPISLKDPGFLKAFYLDAKELGITDHDKAYWWNKSNWFIDSTHDTSLAEMILIDYLLDHPKILDRNSKENNHIRSAMNLPRDMVDERMENAGSILLTLSQQFNLTNKRPSTLEKKYGTEFQKYYFDWIGKGVIAKHINKYSELPDRATLNNMYKVAERNVARAKEMYEGRFTYRRGRIQDEIHSEVFALRERAGNMKGYMDILDAMSGGVLHDVNAIGFGHGSKYYEGRASRLKETFANLGEAWSNKDTSSWKRMKERFPNLTREFERIMEHNKDEVIEPKSFVG